MYRRKTDTCITRGVRVHLGKLTHDAGSERLAEVGAFDVEIGLEGGLGGTGSTVTGDARRVGWMMCVLRWSVMMCVLHW